MSIEPEFVEPPPRSRKIERIPVTIIPSGPRNMTKTTACQSGPTAPSRRSRESGTAFQPLGNALDRAAEENTGQLAFPDRVNTPSRFLQPLAVSPIPRYVGSKFLQPEFDPCGRSGGPGASGMTMPETSMNEHDCPKLRKDEIRSSGKIPDMKAKPETAGVQGAPQGHLRFRVLPANAAHHSGTRLLVDNVRHCLLLPRPPMPGKRVTRR